MYLKQNVGIDVSKDTFKVNLSLLKKDFEKKCLGSREFTNTLDGFEKFIEWVDKLVSLFLNFSCNKDNNNFNNCKFYFLTATK